MGLLSYGDGLQGRHPPVLVVVTRSAVSVAVASLILLVPGTRRVLWHSSWAPRSRFAASRPGRPAAAHASAVAQHDRPHRPAADAFGAGDQPGPACQAAATVMAHAGEDLTRVLSRQAACASLHACCLISGPHPSSGHGQCTSAPSGSAATAAGLRRLSPRPFVPRAPDHRR